MPRSSRTPPRQPYVGYNRGARWKPPLMSLDLGHDILHFRLLEKLGEGGMGQVWRARDTVLDRDVAIKFLPESLASDSDRLSRFGREAKVLAAINHPNIVTIHSLESHAGRPLIVMEMIRGRNLEGLVRPGGLSYADFLRIAAAICDGLQAAHGQSVVHGDLKPANVMITGEGRVKLLDFGLAHPLPVGEIPGASHLTTREVQSTGTISGTLPYMSPEHLQGGPLDARSDIFSLGVLLYEMAAGRRPFSGSNPSEVIASILRDTPRPLDEQRPDLPRHIDRLLKRCLEKDPALRPASVSEIREDLSRLQRDAGSGGPSASPIVAVLPFADMSAEKNQEYFCEGIADEIIIALMRVADLRVVPRTSSFQFRSSSLDVREIGDRLGAGVLLEGGVRKAGERIRITVDLVSVSDGYSLWSERYDRDLKDVFAIQEEIAQKVVEALQVSLSPWVRRAMKQVATSDVVAYEYYLRGRQYFHRYGRRGIEFALEMFRKAIEKDPSFARAHAGVADCCSYLYTNSEHTEANRECADQASLRALEMDPDLPEAHVARGVALSLGGRDAEAMEAFENALKRGPRLFEAHYFYARHCFSRGMMDKAIALYEASSSLQPEDFQAPLLAGQIYEDLGKTEEASSARKRGVDAASKRLDLSPDDVRALYMGANGLVALGEIERGLKWAGRARTIEPDDPMLLYNLGCIYAMAGRTSEAMDCIEAAVRNGFAFKNWLEHDSNLDSVRALPEYPALLARLP